MSFLPSAWYVDGGPQPVVPGVSTLTAANSSGATVGLTIPSVIDDHSGLLAGATVAVFVSEAGSSSPGTLSDGTNTYTLAASQAEGAAGGVAAVYYFRYPANTPSPTLTYTKGTSGAAVGLSAMIIENTAASPLDTGVTATASGTTTSCGVTAASVPTAGDVVVAMTAWSHSATLTLTQGTALPWQMPPRGVATNATSQLSGGFYVHNSSLVPTAAFTLNTAPTGGWASIIVGFKAASPAAGYFGVAPWASGAYNAGQIVRQNATVALGNERCFVCTVGGATGASEPTWVLTSGAKTTDGSVTWIECTGKPAMNGDKTNTPSWTNGSSTAVGQIIKNVAADTFFICTTSSGNTGATEPTWNKTAGATTSDGSNVWTSLGAISNFGALGAPSARLSQAVSSGWIAAGNYVFVGDDHAELFAFTTAVGTQTIAIALPGTTASPNQVLVFDHTASALPPTAANLKSGALVQSTGSITYTGSGYTYGLTLKSGGFTNINTGSGWMKMEGCLLGTWGGNSSIQFGANPGNAANCTELVNTPMSFGVTNTTIGLTGGTLVWRDTPNALVGAAVPTGLFFQEVGTIGPATAFVDGVDFSALGSGKTLVVGTNNTQLFSFLNCKIGSSATVATTGGRGGSKVLFMISDSAAGTPRQEIYAYEGALTTETTDVRSGGASDGVTPLSWKVVTSANATAYDPFETFEIVRWCGVTGSLVTASIAMMSNATLTNMDIWPDVHYLGDASSPLASLASGFAGTVLSSPTSWPTDPSTPWTTTGVSGPVQQLMSVTFTPQQVGFVRIKIKVAKPSQTMRIDPLIQGF